MVEAGATVPDGCDRVYVVMALTADFEDLEDRPLAAYFDRALAEEHRARAQRHLDRQLELQRAWVASPENAGREFTLEPCVYDPAAGTQWSAYWVFEVPLAEALPGA